MEIRISNILDDIAMVTGNIESHPLDAAFILGCIATKLEMIEESLEKNLSIEKRKLND